MVQQEPNITATIKHLASCGAVLKAEQQAALDYSLNIKKAEAGIRSLVLWGRTTTRNGKDYLIAEGYNHTCISEKKVVFEAKYYYSQDGVKWVDLQPVDAATVKYAASFRSQLSGDPMKIYPEASGEEEEAEPEKKDAPVITELQRLRAIIDSINADTGVIPQGCQVLDAQNRLVTNKLFAGLEYPDKLESYLHRTALPDQPGCSLSGDVRGCWSLQHDAFGRVTVLRSLIWPGYCFYYSGQDNTWGSFYMGNGCRNTDLVFML